MKTKSFFIFLFLLTSISVMFPFKVSAQNTRFEIHGVNVEYPDKAKAFFSVLQYQYQPNRDEILNLTPLRIESNKLKAYISGIEIADFDLKLFEDPSSTNNIDIVLAIDTSGSIAMNLATVKRAVISYIDRLRSDKDKISVITFANNPLVSNFNNSPFTDNIEDLKADIQNRTAASRSEHTFLFKAVMEAIKVASYGRSGLDTQKAIIILSDGHDESQGVGFTADDCVREAKKLKIPIFSLGLPDSTERKEPRKFNENLKKLSINTGGAYFEVSDIAPLNSNDVTPLESVYLKLDELIKRQHIFSFTIPRRYLDGQDKTLDLSVSVENEYLQTSFAFKPPLGDSPECVETALFQSAERKGLNKTELTTVINLINPDADACMGLSEDVKKEVKKILENPHLLTLLKLVNQNDINKSQLVYLFNLVKTNVLENATLSSVPQEVIYEVKRILEKKELTDLLKLSEKNMVTQQQLLYIFNSVNPEKNIKLLEHHKDIITEVKSIIDNTEVLDLIRLADKLEINEKELIYIIKVEQKTYQNLKLSNLSIEAVHEVNKIFENSELLDMFRFAIEKSVKPERLTQYINEVSHNKKLSVLSAEKIENIRDKIDPGCNLICYAKRYYFFVLLVLFAAILIVLSLVFYRGGYFRR